ncbi:beta-ribofuranosylaminobenzene 5'-phosphate synthase family protein [Rubrivivax gelatinosus]|uniref:Beta-ribofuranosylaminobenzene 5'-phosphate synthase n=1 Tax=Rubrivivax gelatinosus TaxID=28068 RepID=A0ABS1DUE5_RUBGE|nr:beta-ribofuranosylaminobenzene 5'-phosphate synthase family protein [Rubrivivax gelatinosus]MBK1713662.1 beta-ribofuranosylaminobenzene 5'-phosphate synthase [Rubrivivax gelatinosus]
MISTLPARADALARVAVRAPGRLHLGFLDPAGTLGRRFGSLGLVIDGFETELELGFAEHDSACADSDDGQAELGRALEHLRLLRERSGHDAPLALRLVRVLPPHAGFGSGTQLALALGRAFARLHALELTTPQLAAWLGRGRRSGIGIAGFDAGGLIVDGGPGRDGAPAPVLARLALPAAWRVIVVRHPGRRGLSGDEEKRAIAALPPLPLEGAAELCHQVLMRVLPGAAGDDFTAFAAGLNRVQDLLGGHFAPAQDGSAYTSAEVGRLLQWIRSEAGDAAAVGQSSWGPTGFAILPSAAAAARLLDAALAAGVVSPALAITTVAARAHGARVA